MLVTTKKKLVPFMIPATGVIRMPVYSDPRKGPYIKIAELGAHFIDGLVKSMDIMFEPFTKSNRFRTECFPDAHLHVIRTDLQVCRSKVTRIVFIHGLPEEKSFWEIVKKLLGRQELTEKEVTAIRSILTHEMYGSLQKLKWKLS
jgi:hypothetical protein